MKTESIIRITFFLIACLQMSFILSSCDVIKNDNENITFKVFDTKPVDGEKDVSTLVSVLIEFSTSSDIDETSATRQTVLMADSAGNPVLGDVSSFGTSVTFAPKEPLAAFTTYIVTVKSQLKDTTGQTLGSDYTFSFTTGRGSTA
jgi:Bacterial Ig-like domain